MSEELDPRDDLTDRLRALGQRPVDPALQSHHLTALAGVRPGSAFRTALLGRAKVAAGVFAGFLIGATGLTTAGAMGPLQPIAADVVEAATPLKELPESASAKAKEAREKAKGAGNRTADGNSIGTERDWSDGCVAGEDGTYAGNRGRYLKQERASTEEGALQRAKDSSCGKPIGGEDDDSEELETPEVEGTEDDGEAKGKATAPGQAPEAERGNSADKKPENPGKSADAPEGGKPESTPAVPGVANDQADESTEDVPSATPGEAPADPKAESEVESEV